MIVFDGIAQVGGDGIQQSCLAHLLFFIESVKHSHSDVLMLINFVSMDTR